MKHKTRLFFDLDCTLTPSRQKIKPDMAALLPTLDRTIIVVSGSRNEQIRHQVGELIFYSLGQNGNQAIDESGAVLWQNSITDDEKREILEHVSLIRPRLKHHIPNENDLIEDRGSQISFSIYGHNAPPEEKKACDGNFLKRQALLAACPFVSDTLEVQMGGSTCLDYFKKGSHKGANVKRLIESLGWNARDCVYFGDALFPGGNDESVMGIIDTINVHDEDDTLDKLMMYFA